MSFLSQLPRIARPQGFLNPGQAARCGFQKRRGELACEFVVAAANVFQSVDHGM